MDMNDFRPKGLKEWEINYEFHLGDGLVRGVDWDRTPSNGELPCNDCDRKFGWRYEIMFHSLCHLEDQDGNPKNRVCPECDTVFKVPIGLKHHLLLHTGELPFLCLHCWRSFSSHIDLKLHIRREHLFHLDMPTPKAAPGVKKIKEKKELKEEQIRAEYAAAVATEEGGAAAEQVAAAEGQQVQFVVQNEDGTPGETQTIVLGSDAASSLVDANGQDMIVVIQSDDFDQSQGLIVVDPSQLQQVAGGGEMQMPTSVAISSGSGDGAAAEGENGAGEGQQGEMIVGDQADEQQQQQQYISLQMPDGSTQNSTIVLTEAENTDQQAGATNYIVMTTEGEATPTTSNTTDSKAGLQVTKTSSEN